MAWDSPLVTRTLPDSSTQEMAWTEGPQVGPAGSSGILAAADFAIARLASFGINLPPGSRFQLLRAAVDKAHNHIGPFPSSEVLAEATRSIFELYLISRCLRSDGRPLSDTLDTTIRKILEGPLLPRDENERNSAARNFQFELSVGAWLTAGGVEGRLAEPDLQIMFLGRSIGVAAKRVSSRKQLLRRVKDAIAQIDASGMDGLIAINVDPLIDELQLTGNREDIVRAFESAVPELGQALALAARHPRVVGLLALGMHDAWEDAEPRPRVMMSSFVDWKFLPHDAEEETKINAFFAEFRKTHDARMKNL
jgi:hypothetical protein